jgi:MFS family permease
VIVLPVAAALIALAFSVHLFSRSGRRGTWYEAVWGLAMLMFAVATGALVLGVLDGWSSAEFRAYWLFGAVLTAPYLAMGELYLLVRRRWIAHVLLILLLGATAWAAATVRTAPMSEALFEDFPLGREVFGDGSAAHRLSQYYAFPGYFILVGGAVWSALQMRGRAELRDRFLGVLLIALGATVVFIGSGVGAGFGLYAVFSLGHAAGIAVMYWGFLMASRRRPAPVPATAREGTGGRGP